MNRTESPGLRLRVETTTLLPEPGDWDAMVRNLDNDLGIYCAALHGVPGLHPRFAWVINDTALRLEIFANSVRINAVGRGGLSILASEALIALIEPLDRGLGLARLGAAVGGHAPPAASGDDRQPHQPLSRQHPVAGWLRAFLAAFDAREPFGLFGALKFEAHKLGGPWMPNDETLLGVLLVPEAVLIQEVDAPAQLIRFVYPEPANGAGPFVQPMLTPQPMLTAQPVLTPEPRSDGRRHFASQDDHPRGGHALVVARGLDALENQSLISLTLSQSFRRPWRGSAASAFERLRDVNPAPVTFLAHLLPGEHLFGASPDLQLMVRNRRIQSFPVCGTVRRTPGPIGHAQALKSLINEAVDEAALAICSDALKNDLAPFCEPGSVRLIARREPLSLATVVHAVDVLEGDLLADSDHFDVVLATTAPAMVTGTPRSLALASIKQLETSAREWYGGLVVRLGVGGDAEAGTILRAAWLHDGIAEVRTGGDLVAGSDPLREDEETRLKAISLWRALGLEEPAGVVSATNAALKARSGGSATRGGSGDRIRANRLIWRACSDPFDQSLNDLLGAAELACDAEFEEVLILSGTASTLLEQVRDQNVGVPTLAIGPAATLLVERECAGLRTSSQVENGRLLWLEATAPEAIDWPSLFYAGSYGKRLLFEGAIKHNTLGDWQCIQSACDGEWVSAINPQTRTVVLCFRPDSVLSEAGARQTLRKAIDWLRASK